MTKKFTEEEYQKIVGIADRLKKEYDMGFLNNSLVYLMQEELFDDFNLVDDWQEIVAIANPITRKWAYEQFVEKEKKYLWRYKKSDHHDYKMYLKKTRGLIMLDSGLPSSFTETEVIEAGYNPNMFFKEEV